MNKSFFKKFYLPEVTPLEGIAKCCTQAEVLIQAGCQAKEISRFLIKTVLSISRIYSPCGRTDLKIEGPT